MKKATNLNELIQQATEHLKSLKYLSYSLEQYTRIWRLLKQYADTRNAENYSTELGHSFLEHHYGVAVGQEKKKIDHVRSRAIRILSDYQLSGAIIKKICHKVEPFPKQYDKLFSEYIKTLVDSEKPKSRIKTETLHLRYLGSYLEQKEVKAFAQVSRQDIVGFMQTFTCFARSTISHILRTTRSLLGYAFEKGYHQEDLSDVCPKVRFLQKTKIPSAYTLEEVEAILKAVDRGNPIGKRDYAVLILAARLGIRASDIRELKFSDFDWNTGKITILQQKTKKEAVYEITDELADVLIDYIKYGRPESSDERIFIRHTAPYDGFSDTYKFYNVINKYMVLANITIPQGKRHGLHSLRHSLASRMLEQGIPITTIADVLSHDYIDTTTIYTKIDIPQLALCALEVPYERA